MSAAASVNRDFSGLDGEGNPRTMNFTGYATATGNYGILRTGAWGTLSNTVYNTQANPPLWNSDTGEVNEAEGVPDGLIAAAWASFTDVLQYGGTAVGYQARYTFFLHGTVSGTDAYTYLDVTIAGNEESFQVPGSGAVGEYFTTDAYPIGGPGHTMEVTLSSQYLPNAFGPAGSTYSGASLFGQTLTLTGIQVEDEFGVPVAGWQVTSASGTQYPVPEPGTLALIIAMLGLRARLRHNQTAGG